MTPEQHRPKRPYELFGITEDEVTRWRLTDERLKQILADPNTITNKVQLNSNNYGEFMFVTASRGKGTGRICMTFYSYGYHQFRERWITEELFWRQTSADMISPADKLSFEEAQEVLSERLTEISPHLNEDTQSDLGRMFEAIADMTDDDAALAEMQDMGLL
jgi:hypothetical protein